MRPGRKGLAFEPLKSSMPLHVFECLLRPSRALLPSTLGELVCLPQDPGLHFQGEANAVTKLLPTQERQLLWRPGSRHPTPLATGCLAWCLCSSEQSIAFYNACDWSSPLDGPKMVEGTVILVELKLLPQLQEHGVKSDSFSPVSPCLYHRTDDFSTK